MIRRKRTVGRTLMMTTGRVIEALSFYHSLCISLKLDHIKEEASKVKANCRSPWCTRFVKVTNEHDDDLATLLMKINVVFSSLPLLIGFLP